MTISSISNTATNNQLQAHTSTLPAKPQLKTDNTDIGPASIVELGSKTTSMQPATYSRAS